MQYRSMSRSAVHALCPVPARSLLSCWAERPAELPGKGAVDQQLGKPQRKEYGMDVPANLLDQPLRRRWWLLLRALESQPLDEALKKAQAAEDLLTGDGSVPTEQLNLLKSLRLH
jgi:hypothetical protein